jgi:hypothetical protein
VDLGECFSVRIVAQLGVPIPPNQVDEISRQLISDPSAPVAGMSQIPGFSIGDAKSGDTKTLSTVRLKQLAVAIIANHQMKTDIFIYYPWRPIRTFLW